MGCKIHFYDRVRENITKIFLQFLAKHAKKTHEKNKAKKSRPATQLRLDLAPLQFQEEWRAEAQEILRHYKVESLSPRDARNATGKSCSRISDAHKSTFSFDAPKQLLSEKFPRENSSCIIIEKRQGEPKDNTKNERKGQSGSVKKKVRIVSKPWHIFNGERFSKENPVPHVNGLTRRLRAKAMLILQDISTISKESCGATFPLKTSWIAGRETLRTSIDGIGAMLASCDAAIMKAKSFRSEALRGLYPLRLLEEHYLESQHQYETQLQLIRVRHQRDLSAIKLGEKVLAEASSALQSKGFLASFRRLKAGWRMAKFTKRYRNLDGEIGLAVKKDMSAYKQTLSDAQSTFERYAKQHSQAKEMEANKRAQKTLHMERGTACA